MTTPVEGAPLIGLATLARMAFAGEDLAPVKTRLLDRLRRNDNDAEALLDLSTVLHITGQRRLGLSTQEFALKIRQTYRLPVAAGSTALRLLAFVTPGDLSQNNALEFLTEDSDIALHLVYVGPGLPLPPALPEHDLAMVAICETDRNRVLLRQLKESLKHWPRPVLCAPERIARLSRDGASVLLQAIPGAIMPVSKRIGRMDLAGMATGVYPLIIRPVDSQRGQGLRKLETPEDAAAYLESRREACHYLSRYVDYRSPDELYRKYRIVLIDGRPYACHMAISDRWMVHYMSAGMGESAAKRAEEARFFETFESRFLERHGAALGAIAERLALEYVGLDCGQTPEGQLLIFEVDSGMTVHSMDSPELFPYKKPQMGKVFAAFRRMLLDHLGGSSVPAK